ncbi:MAG: sigma-70 family RNA polymerase sigma factor [Bacteroidia bacterium]|nr:sigma-70 family RNA polymerase sigma factor [Bacteroidia bacterium]
MKTDEVIIQAILAGGAQREKMIHYLYDDAYSGMTFKIQRKLLLTDEEVQDAYSDAIVKLDQQIRSGKFEGKSKLSTYFFRIFYNKGVDILRKRLPNTKITYLPEEQGAHVPDPTETILELLQADDNIRMVRGYLSQIGETCQKILIMFYNRYTMEEIAVETGLKNAESATSQKYKCFKKLSDILMEAGVIPKVSKK